MKPFKTISEQIEILKDRKLNILSEEQAKLNLQRYNIKIKDYPKPINHYVLNLIIDFYSIKEDEKYCYKHTIGNNIHHTYSQQFVDFIISEIRKNPDSFVTSLKSANKKR
ncbi:hypothetical protein WJ437_09160 [Ignavigranum ruoffiae]|uniref:hypothetical protein n=1 Tax=Ignavigranum ruoffiae TaxID=89093 RepID=UPI003AFF6472